MSADGVGLVCAAKLGRGVVFCKSGQAQASAGSVENPRTKNWNLNNSWMPPSEKQREFQHLSFQGYILDHVHRF